MASRLQDVIQRGTRASQPLATAVATGTIYFVTDEGVLERSNGTTWQSFSSFGPSINSSSLPLIVPATEDEIDQFGSYSPYSLSRIKNELSSTDLLDSANIPHLNAYNIWAGRGQWNAATALNSPITPTALVASVNDYNPTNLVNANVIRLSTDGGSYNITGLAAVANSITTGYFTLLINIGASGVITLVNNSGSSAAGNKFRCPNATDVPLNPGESLWVWYDATSTVWQVVKSLTSATTPTVNSVSIHLTASQINTLNSVPVSVVAGQGSTAVIIPIMALWKMNRSANVFSGDPVFRLRYTGYTTNLLGTTPTFVLNGAGPDSQFRDSTPAVFNFGGGGNDPRNKAIEISTDADTTGGSGATMDFSVAYYVATTS